MWTWHGLVTFYTVFVIDLASRRVQILGSTPQPDETFMCQIVRNLTLGDADRCRVLARWVAQLLRASSVNDLASFAIGTGHYGMFE